MQVGKTRNIIGWVLSALPVLALLASAFKKFTATPEYKAKLKFIDHIPLPVLAVISLLCVLLYLIPKTSNLGFFLMCSYFGGVIAGELVMGEFPLVGILMSVCLYVGTMLKKPELSGLGI